MMSQRHRSGRHRWVWGRTLRQWQRIVLIGVLAAVLIISTVLIYFHPRAEDQTIPIPTLTGTIEPEYPPGTRWYYRRSQWNQPELPPP
jgi:hypothetical protein